MSSADEHDHAKDPSLVATALPVWLISIATMWVFVATYGYFWDSVVAFLVWGAICFGVCSTFVCRHAGHMRTIDVLKLLVLLALPWVAEFWYAINVAPHLSN